MSSDFLIGTGLLALLVFGSIALSVLGTVVWPEYKRRLTGENLHAVADLVDKIMVAAVAYAEQVHEGSEEKRAAAIAYAERELMRYGIKMDLESIADHIEATVYQYLNYLAKNWGQV